MNPLGDLKALFESTQKLQAEMARIKGELAHKTVSGEAGGGLVRCVANGKGDVVALELDSTLTASLSATDKKMLEDLIVGAVNVALDRARELAQAEMGRIASGLPLPPGFLGQEG